nr:PRC-barrel domain-containing protein [Brachybacterium muris]
MGVRRGRARRGGRPPVTRSTPAPEHVQQLSGASVRGSDGEHVGRVRDIYLHDATGELAAITVSVGRLRGRTVLLPAVAIAPGALTELFDTPSQALTLVVDAAAARAGAAPPDTAHADPQTLRRAARALGIEEAPAG